jgi:hypothetical protein
MGDRTRYKTLGLGDLLDDEVKGIEGGLMAVTRQAINDMVDEATLPVAKGGRMPIDTGFLRKSGAAEIGSWPTGPSRGDPDAAKGFYDTGDGAGSDNPSLILALGRWKPGDTLYYGWTAEYAAPQEAKRMFMEDAAAKWARFVASAASRFLSNRNVKRD